MCWGKSVSIPNDELDVDAQPDTVGLPFLCGGVCYVCGDFLNTPVKIEEASAKRRSHFVFPN
jgi:hypothetical protein